MSGKFRSAGHQIQNAMRVARDSRSDHMEDTEDSPYRGLQQKRRDKPPAADSRPDPPSNNPSYSQNQASQGGHISNHGWQSHGNALPSLNQSQPLQHGLYSTQPFGQYSQSNNQYSQPYGNYYQGNANQSLPQSLNVANHNYGASYATGSPINHQSPTHNSNSSPPQSSSGANNTYGVFYAAGSPTNNASLMFDPKSFRPNHLQHTTSDPYSQDSAYPVNGPSYPGGGPYYSSHSNPPLRPFSAPAQPICHHGIRYNLP